LKNIAHGHEGLEKHRFFQTSNRHWVIKGSSYSDQRITLSAGCIIEKLELDLVIFQVKLRSDTD